MSQELMLWLGGFCVTSGGALIATIWAMLNAKIAEQKRECSLLRERIADLYAKLEKARERSDEHRFEMLKYVYEKGGTNG
jgi:uncharacterized coiled-coil protein SlyX